MAKKTVIGKKRGSKKASPQKKSTAAKALKKVGPRRSAKVPLPKGPVWQWSAVETAAAIRSGAISSVEVINVHTERKRAVNPRLNAVVVDLSEQAIKAAKAADSATAKGKELGPLHGVPITIKENVDYDGRPNPNGVPAQMKIVAPSDAPVVRNLKKGDEIVTNGGLVGEVLFIKEKSGDDKAGGMEDRVTIKSGDTRVIIERGRIAKINRPVSAASSATTGRASSTSGCWATRVFASRQSASPRSPTSCAS